ncbi:chorismate-binding protein [Vibrio sp. PP-XX7]
MEKTIDMAATYCRGRAANTPVRSFLLRNSHQQAVGFCPELVMSVHHGRVVTEPLAGTRALVGSEAQKRRYRDELQHDHKEVVEHIQSVKAAIDELQSVCEVASIAVNDLMTVRERGSVRHLGSTVSGQLREGNDVWDAFRAVSGNYGFRDRQRPGAQPRICSMESTPENLYSGAILAAGRD